MNERGVCAKCGVEKDLIEGFYAAARSKSGRRCNRMLGLGQDNPRLFQAAIDYLEAYRESQ